MCVHVRVQVNTHLGINQALCGTPVVVKPEYAEVKMATLASMVADDRGLIHGGFYFSMADYSVSSC